MTLLTHGSSTALLGNDLPDWIRNEPPNFPLDDSGIHSTMKPPRAIHQAECVIPLLQKVFHCWSELFCIRLMLLISLLVCGCSDQEQAKELLERRRSEQLRQRAEEASASEVEMLAMQLTDLIIAEKEEGTEAWYVSKTDSDAYVKIPFEPPTGRLLDADSEAAVENRFPSRFRSVSELREITSEINHNPGFVGAAVCSECHQERHRGFIHTAHHKTSGWMPNVNPHEPSPSGQENEDGNVWSTGNGMDSSIEVHGVYADALGSKILTDSMGSPVTEIAALEGGVLEGRAPGAIDASVMQSSDSDLRFQMTRGPGGFWQNVHLADYDLSLPVHVFTGSAKAGQTFLYWHQRKLYQSFVSYLTDLDRWIPSPGYFDTTADYTREIGTTCLECHVTYIERGDQRGTLKPDTAIWGISCERCHGPGRQHVEHHRSFPNEKVAVDIAQPADLPRQRQLDICSQCHSGGESLITGKFEFRPGMEISKARRSAGTDEVGGVHTANQLNRLEMSRCFQSSEMTCTTCHDPHVDQRGLRKVFSQSCLQCHQPSHCGQSEVVGPSISDNCIDCHMPTGDNDQMTIEVGGGDLFTVKMIDHHIRVDQDATADFFELRASHNASESKE